MLSASRYIGLWSIISCQQGNVVLTKPSIHIHVALEEPCFCIAVSEVYAVGFCNQKMAWVVVLLPETPSFSRYHLDL